MEEYKIELQVANIIYFTYPLYIDFFPLPHTPEKKLQRLEKICGRGQKNLFFDLETRNFTNVIPNVLLFSKEMTLKNALFCMNTPNQLGPKQIQNTVIAVGMVRRLIFLFQGHPPTLVLYFLFPKEKLIT